MKIADDAVITTKAASGQNGTWRSIQMASPSRDQGDITGATLSGELTLGNVTIVSTSVQRQ